MDKLQTLLSHVRIISSKNNEIQEATGGRFNIFGICGVNHYENTHSAIIAEFLNSRGSHGLKSKLLESFIEMLDQHFIIKGFNSKQATVYTEYSTEEGRIDILIEDDENRAIILENKIYANDQPEQLIRYDRYAQSYRNGYQILYLTLFGDEASEQSGDSVAYLPISYAIEIINWLEKCVSIASRVPVVRETIIQYINHLKQLTNQDMDVKNKEEITQLLSEINNLRAAKTIYQNYSATYDYLAKTYFNPKMEALAATLGLEFQYETAEESYIKFTCSKTSWAGNYWISFTFDNSGYYYGVYQKVETFSISNENRQLLHSKLTQSGISKMRSNNAWLCYIYITNLTIDSWESDIIKSEKFLGDCKEKLVALVNAIDSLDL